MTRAVTPGPHRPSLSRWRAALGDALRRAPSGLLSPALLRRLAAGAAVGLLAMGLLTWGSLPALMPPRPPPLSSQEQAALAQRRTIEADGLGSGPSTVPAIRLLDHLEDAQREHPPLLRAYRSLGRGRGGAPGHWRHYVDPWSGLPPSLAPLRVQVAFFSQDVRGYARRPGPPAAVAPDSPAAEPAKRRGAARRIRPGPLDPPGRHRNGEARRHPGAPAAAPAVRRRGAGRPALPRNRIPVGRDRKMNRTRGVNEMRLALLAPAPARFAFRVVVPERPLLTFGLGVPLNSPDGAVTVSVGLREGARPLRRIFSRTLEPAERGAWHDVRVDLSPWSGKEVWLTLRVEGPRDAVAFLSNPVVWKRGARPPGKNVVFLLVDTLRADAVGARDASGASVTPTMDRLARSGVTFTECISLASWTRSSLLSMFTGDWVSRLSPRLNTAFFLPQRFRARMYRRWPRLLTRHLREQGYWVEAIGNNFFLPGFTPIGFDRAFDRVTDIRDVLEDTPAITRAAVRFLDRHRRRPFFLYLHYDGPHAPYLVPKGYRVRGARAPGAPHDRAWEMYLGEARWTDANLTPVLDALRRLGLARETLVVFTGDHGEVFHAAHDVIYRNNHRTLHHHGWSVFREVLHVPWILSLPGSLPAGRRIGARVSHLDLVPTLLDLIGAPPLSGHRGRSLAEALRRGGRVADSPALASLGRNLYSLFSGRYHLILRDYLTQSYRRPHAPGKLFYSRADLYDVVTDPEETRNIARQHPSVVAQLTARLKSLVLPRRGHGAGGASGAAGLFGQDGLRVGLRISGGSGTHRLEGTLRCGRAVVVRSLRGPRSRAASPAKGEAAIQLESRGGRPAEAILEFLGCSPNRLRLALRRDGRPVTARDVLAGPVGLALLERADRLPMLRLVGLVSREPPPVLAAAQPQVHLWLGGPGSASLAWMPSPQDAAARLANQMLRGAGYVQSPRSAARPAPPRPGGTSPARP